MCITRACRANDTSTANAGNSYLNGYAQYVNLLAQILESNVSSPRPLLTIPHIPVQVRLSVADAYCVLEDLFRYDRASPGHRVIGNPRNVCIITSKPLYSIRYSVTLLLSTEN